MRVRVKKKLIGVVKASALLYFLVPLLVCSQSISSLSNDLAGSHRVEITWDSVDIAHLALTQKKEIKHSEGFYIQLEKVKYFVQRDTIVLLNHLVLLAKEIVKYPIHYFQRIGLRKIVLVNEAKYNKETYRREAIPIPEREVLILESSHRLINDTTYLKYAFHHDLYHYMEKVHFGSYNQKKWLKLNPRKFKYRGNGSMQYQSRWKNVDWSFPHPQPGFINNYSMTAEEEDRAEVFSHLMVEEYRDEILKLADKDNIIENKVKYLDELMKEITGDNVLRLNPND